MIFTQLTEFFLQPHTLFSGPAQLPSAGRDADRASVGRAEERLVDRHGGDAN